MDFIEIDNIQYEISNKKALDNANELELDIVEPSIICHGNTSTEKVKIIGDYSKEELLNIYRKVVKLYVNR